MNRFKHFLIALALFVAGPAMAEIDTIFGPWGEVYYLTDGQSDTLSLGFVIAEDGFTVTSHEFRSILIFVQPRAPRLHADEVRLGVSLSLGADGVANFAIYQVHVNQCVRTLCDSIPVFNDAGNGPNNQPFGYLSSPVKIIGEPHEHVTVWITLDPVAANRWNIQQTRWFGLGIVKIPTPTSSDRFQFFNSSALRIITDE